MSVPSYGVVVCRLQVNDLHTGHIALFDEVVARHGESAVIVFIAEPANKSLTQDNPLDFPTRHAMLRARYPKFIIQPLMDCRTDEEWSKNLDAAIAAAIKIGRVTLYGGRDSFVPHYVGRHTPVELALPTGTMRISGTDVRAKVSNDVQESAAFRAGMIYAAHHQWNESKPCVDVAIFNHDWSELLLVRKVGEDLFRFLGGHFEEKHGSWEGTLKAEGWEESGLVLEDKPTYIGSTVVDDWRYKGVPDKCIVTSFFAVRTPVMGAMPQDKKEIAEARWFPFHTIRESDLVPEHRVLLAKLQQYRKTVSPETQVVTDQGVQDIQYATPGHKVLTPDGWVEVK